MLQRRTAKLVAGLVATALLGTACTSRDDDTEAGDADDTAAGDAAIDTSDCATDPTAEVEGDAIEIVSSYPQSGLTAAFSEIARGWKAYFDKVNAEGGVDFGGKTVTIEYEDRDDEYDPSRTVANIDELLGPEGDGAFAVFSVVGTANNIAIRQTLDELCVPNVFAATGAPQWGNPDYPWLIGSSLSPYPLEGYMFARVLEEENPTATVAMLVQDDDFGRDYQEGFERAIEGTDIEIVKVERYTAGTGDVGAQITSLAASGAEAFFNGGTLLACPDGLTEAAQNDWRPITWVSSTCLSETLMGLAGAAGDGVWGAANLKDPLNPDWDDDEAMIEYLDTVREYQPDGFSETNAVVAYGYTQAALFVAALEAAEAPTRLALMESVRNLEVSDVGLLLPDVTIRTGEGDAYMAESLMAARYEFLGEGERNHFVPTGELVDFEGQTAELTPEDLITG